jgi:hypothetical protein
MSVRIDVKENKSLRNEIKPSYKYVLFAAFLVFLNKKSRQNIKQKQQIMLIL